MFPQILREAQGVTRHRLARTTRAPKLLLRIGHRCAGPTDWALSVRSTTLCSSQTLHAGAGSSGSLVQRPSDDEYEVLEGVVREMPAESSSSCCAACGRLRQVLAGANKVYLQAGFTMHVYAITVASALDLGGCC